jgi:hypothetical protein
MELVIRIALMFFFIQFVVIVTLMSMTLLMVRPGIPIWGREPGRAVLVRSVAFAIHLPGRGFRSVVRRVKSVHLHSAD